MAGKNKKKRGVFLTTMNILNVIVLLLLFLSLLVPSINKEAFQNLPSLYPLFTYILMLVSALSFYGIWTWQKWGVNLYLCISIAAFLIEFITLPNQSMTLIWGIFTGAIYFCAIYRKWSYFK